MPGPPGVILSHRPHPFKLERVTIELPAGLTVLQMVEIAQPDPALRACMAVRIAGRTWPRETWPGLRPKPGVLIDMVPLPQGGGDTLRLVLTIAVVALAVAATGGIAGLPIFAAGGALAGWGAVAGAVGGSLISVVGMLAINALVPPAQPQINQGLASTSVAYTIEGASNRARPDQPIPRVLGRHRYVADLAAPWVTELDDQDEYLHGILCWGYGPCSVTELRIGDTPIENFRGVALEHYAGDSDTPPSFTLYPNQVSLEQVASALRRGTRVRRTTDTDTAYALLVFQFRQGAVRISNSTGDTLGVEVTLRYRWRAVDGDWSAEADWPMSGRSNSPLKRARRINFPAAGQYEIEVWRVTANSGSDSQIDAVHWEVLKSGNYEAPLRNLLGVAFTAVRIKATDQLNGVIQDLSGLVTSYAPQWTGSAWVYGPTVQPAALFRSVLQGRAAKSATPDQLIDLAQLQHWAEYTAPRGFDCELVLDRELSLGETLDLICATGRAAKLQVDGRWSVAIDEPKSTPVQMFTARNMRGFRGRRLFVDEPHALRVRFVDRTAGYTQQTRLVYADGYGPENASLIEDAEFPGVTNPDVIHVMGRMRLAEGRLRAETYTAEIDFEHLVCTRGDLVLVQHSAPLWGLGSGRVKSLILDGTDIVALVLDERLVFDGTAADYIVRVRRSDTTIFFSDIHDPVGEADTVYLNPPADAGTAGIAAGDLAGIGIRDRDAVQLLVRSIEPSGDLAAQVSFIPYAPEIHTAAIGPIPAWDPLITAPTGSRTPIIEAVASGEATGVRNADGSITARVLVRLANDGSRPLATIAGLELAWKPLGDTGPFLIIAAPADASQIAITEAAPGTTIRIAARFRLYSGYGAWSSEVQHLVVGPTLRPLDVKGLVADGLYLRWIFTAGPDHLGFRVRWTNVADEAWEDAEDITDELVREYAVPTALFPIGALVILVKAVTIHGLESATAARVAVTITEASQRVDLGADDLRDRGWPGSLAGAQVIGGEIRALDNSEWLGTPGRWLDPPSGIWLEPEWSEVTYLANIVTPASLIATDRIFLDWDISGDFKIAYRWGTADLLFSPLSDPIPESILDGDLSLPLGATVDAEVLLVWRAWRQGLPALKSQPLQLRVIVAGGAEVQPAIRSLRLRFDAAEIVEVFPSFAIPAGGALVPIKRKYRVISYVQGTVQAGSAAAAVVTQAKTPKPRVGLQNTAGASVAGVADIVIGGG